MFTTPTLPKTSQPFGDTLRNMLGNLTDGQKAHSAYFSIIFLALMAWGLGVYVLYRTVGGPDLAMTDRVNVFGRKLYFRLILFFAILLIIRALVLVKNLKGEGLIDHCVKAVRSDPFWLPRTAFFAALGAISFLYVQVNFMSVKTAMPMIQPFYFDEIARNIDRILFFGTDPWRALSWVHASPHAMSVIDVSYTTWIILITGFWMYAFTTRMIVRRRRFQYVLSMMLIWFIGGNLLAILLSSAGPCYYHIFGADPDYYAGLMSSLAAVNEHTYIDAFNYQDTLLSMYNNPETRFGGISAAPSLHVGASLLLLMFFWQNIIARIILIVFNVIIYVGSIMLAWHYAIDGIISVPVVFFCWYLAGKITGAVERRWPEDQAAATKA